MSFRVDIHKGIVLLASDPYDDTIVERIRDLPDRRYRRETHDWIVPARREHLRELCLVIAELDERDVDVQLSSQAAGRLKRADIARAILRGRAIEIKGPYNPQRVQALRDVPERQFDAATKTWTIALTRASAVALMAFAEQTDKLVITARASAELARCAAGSPPSVTSARNEDPATRRSPTAHWRHFTSGPVFDNPARERVNVPKIGLCVRVRVNPRHSRQRPAQPSPHESPPR